MVAVALEKIDAVDPKAAALLRRCVATSPAARPTARELLAAMEAHFSAPSEGHCGPEAHDCPEGPVCGGDLPVALPAALATVFAEMNVSDSAQL
mmetsp:Transcript_18671/g.31748  ORF Transcript_18671/g.31748 Transcript_18671/m.31748 type:complete len:94 (+) Transcript_18671:1-282(+)